MPSPDTEIVLDAAAAFPVVRVRGEIDLANIGVFEAALAEAGGLQCGSVVVSFVESTYCDSRTVQALLAFRAQLESAGATLLLVLPSRGTPRRVLEIVGVTRRLPIYRTVAEALVAADEAKERARLSMP